MKTVKDKHENSEGFYFDQKKGQETAQFSAVTFTSIIFWKISASFSDRTNSFKQK